MRPDARSRRRRPRSTGNEEWRPIIEAFRRSGLSRRAFCEETTVPLSTLNWWLTKARREASPAPVAFTEVRLPSSPPSGPSSPPTWSLEIVLPDGVTLRFGDALSIAALVQLLREARC